MTLDEVYQDVMRMKTHIDNMEPSREVKMIITPNRFRTKNPELMNKKEEVTIVQVLYSALIYNNMVDLEVFDTVCNDFPKCGKYYDMVKDEVDIVKRKLDEYHRTVENGRKNDEELTKMYENMDLYYDFMKEPLSEFKQVVRRLCYSEGTKSVNARRMVGSIIGSYIIASEVCDITFNMFNDYAKVCPTIAGNFYSVRDTYTIKEVMIAVGNLLNKCCEITGCKAQFSGNKEISDAWENTLVKMTDKRIWSKIMDKSRSSRYW